MQIIKAMLRYMRRVLRSIVEIVDVDEIARLGYVQNRVKSPACKVYVHNLETTEKSSKDFHTYTIAFVV